MAGPAPRLVLVSAFGGIIHQIEHVLSRAPVEHPLAVSLKKSERSTETSEFPLSTQVDPGSYGFGRTGFYQLRSPMGELLSIRWKEAHTGIVAVWRSFRTGIVETVQSRTEYGAQRRFVP